LVNDPHLIFVRSATLPPESREPFRSPEGPAEPWQADAGASHFALCCKEGNSLGDAGLYGIIGMNLEMAFLNAPRERE